MQTTGQNLTSLAEGCISPMQFLLRESRRIGVTKEEKLCIREWLMEPSVLPWQLLRLAHAADIHPDYLWAAFTPQMLVALSADQLARLGKALGLCDTEIERFSEFFVATGAEWSETEAEMATPTLRERLAARRRAGIPPEDRRWDQEGLTPPSAIKPFAEVADEPAAPIDVVGAEEVRESPFKKSTQPQEQAAELDTEPHPVEPAINGHSQESAIDPATVRVLVVPESRPAKPPTLLERLRNGEIETSEFYYGRRADELNLNIHWVSDQTDIAVVQIEQLEADPAYRLPFGQLQRLATVLDVPVGDLFEAHKRQCPAR